MALTGDHQAGQSGHDGDHNLLDHLAVNAVQRWEANTAYTAGQTVLNPSGELVNALAAFTSTAVYSAANWTQAGSGTYPLTRVVDQNGTPVSLPSKRIVLTLDASGEIDDIQIEVVA